MMNRFVLGLSECKTHHLPQSLICLDSKCTATALLCPNCAKYQHPHLDQIMSLQEFYNYFQKFLEKGKDKQEEDRYSLSVSAMVRAKKQQVERSQIEVMQLMVKRLAQQKKRMFQALDYIEKHYGQKEHYLNKHQQHKINIMNYLLPYSKEKELFQIKIRSASPWGITKLKQQLTELDKLSTMFGKKDLQLLQQNVTREINMSLDFSLFRSARQCFKQTVKSQPLLFVPQPPPKKYSFRQRQSPESTSTRPTSCNQTKGRSLQYLRPIQARSHIM